MTAAADAVALIRSGMNVFVHGAAATPTPLLEALAARTDVEDVTLYHLHTQGPVPFAEPDCAGRFRSVSFFTGSNLRRAIDEGRADFIPVFLSDIPSLLTSGRIRLDAALLQLSPCDRQGFCSLGTSVDAARAAADTAPLLIAEINAQMPRTLGLSHVSDSRLMARVHTDRPLWEHAPEPENAVTARIGEIVADLVCDGDTLQAGIGAIPDAVLARLHDKHDLGIHTEMFTDRVVDLMKSGAVTNRRKQIFPKRTVTSFVAGTRRLFDFLDDNPQIEFLPCDITNDTNLLRKVDGLVAINSALEVDLSGQVCADSIGPHIFSGIGGQMDFIRGAALSRGGKPILAFPSTAKDGKISRIVCQLTPGAGVVTTRGHVHRVATEYGAVNLHGLTLRERGQALISIAHPDFRAGLGRELSAVRHFPVPDPRNRSHQISYHMTNPPAIAAQSPGQPWHNQSAEKVLAQLGSKASGLSTTEAAQRLAADGPNELNEGKRINPWQIFLGQFRSLIVWILIVAGIISGLLGEMVDAIAILAIVVLNAAIGFYQEHSAEKSIAALRKMAAPQAKVWRDGAIKAVPAAKIVTGDVLELEAGDLVAADARLLSAASFKCVESALTGESDAVEKQAGTLDQAEVPLGDRKNMIFMGTSVAAGSGRALVVATAMQTEIGGIAGLLAEAGADEETPLQQKLASFGRILVWASLGIVALLFALGLARGMPFLELFMTAVSLAVAAVPEGLPTVVTVALALGVMRMSRRRALVRKLPAVETLGSTNVICTDKTGTLTVGEMTVRVLYVSGQKFEVTGEGYGPEGKVCFAGKAADDCQTKLLRELAYNLIGCNNAHLALDNGQWKVIGDPTEGAMLAAGHKAGVTREQIEHELPKRHEIPFDSDRKRQSVIRRMPEGCHRAFINGAPDLLLQRCTRIVTTEGVRPFSDADRADIVAQNIALAGQALRVLGSAYRDLDATQPDQLKAEDVEHDLVFVGLTGMYDPPRTEAKEAIVKCRAAGIRVVMITGDHPHTAAAIARELGIATDKDLALSGAELDQFSDEELHRRVTQIAVYARVTAAHKLRIIRAWKASGAVVAMTGDGVNDAPAIKGADIGIAMGRSGTEVTKQASDMIVTDDNFASIVAAVEEGRGIYDNIRKTLQYLLAGNCGELLLMTAAIIMGLPMPLLALHLLWINLVTDGLPALCLATDPIDADVMKQPPRSRNERITDGGFLGTMFLTGLLTAGVSLAVYVYALKHESLEMARTHAFAALVFAELLRAFGARSETRPFWRINHLSNLNLIAVVAISSGIQVWSHHNAMLAGFLKTSLMPLSECLMLLAVGAIPLIVLEIVKVARNSLRGGHRQPGIETCST